MEKNIALVNGILIDGHIDHDPVSNVTILVKNDLTEGMKGTIEATGQELHVPDSYRIIDLEGKYVLPGLINAHCHILGNGRPFGTANEKKIQTLAKLSKTWLGKIIVLRMMRKNMKNAVSAGVTTVRSMGEPHYYEIITRDSIESGTIIGSRILASGMGLCITGGHGSYMAHVIDSPWEARKAVRENLRECVDWIKLISTGGVMDARKIGEAGRPQMTVDEISAACDEAHRAEIMVAAHAESTKGIKEALLGGVDTIEHGAYLDDECISLFKNNKNSLRGYSALVPTISAGTEITKHTIEETKMSPVQMKNAELIRDGCIQGLQIALEKNIKLGVGTDASVPYVTHYNLWRELEYYTAHGNISNNHAIHLATLANAEILGIDHLTGSVEKGKVADIIVLDKNPLEELNALASPSIVITRGIALMHPSVKKVKHAGEYI